MSAQNDFPIVFEQLKNILQPYAKTLPSRRIRLILTISMVLTVKDGKRNCSSVPRKSRRTTSRFI